MPATRSRTSTEQPEVAVEEGKKSDVEHSEENTKESLGNEESNDNTTSTTTDEKEVESENGNDTDSQDVLSVEKEVTNGDSVVAEKATDLTEVSEVSGKRKSEVGDGDGPDSTEITPKKVKLDDEVDLGVSDVQDNGAVGEVEASV